MGSGSGWVWGVTAVRGLWVLAASCCPRDGDDATWEMDRARLVGRPRGVHRIRARMDALRISWQYDRPSGGIGGGHGGGSAAAREGARLVPDTMSASGVGPSGHPTETREATSTRGLAEGAICIR